VLSTGQSQKGQIGANQWIQSYWQVGMEWIGGGKRREGSVNENFLQISILKKEKSSNGNRWLLAVSPIFLIDSVFFLFYTLPIKSNLLSNHPKDIF
jgi:hypothetical protein